jgi:hypothetical protein
VVSRVSVSLVRRGVARCYFPRQDLVANAARAFIILRRTSKNSVRTADGARFRENSAETLRRQTCPIRERATAENEALGPVDHPDDGRAVRGTPQSAGINLG